MAVGKDAGAKAVTTPRKSKLKPVAGRARPNAEPTSS